MPQGTKGHSEQLQLQDDIKFLLSNVRARQNGLVFFLQLFSMAARSKIQTQQYRIYKQEFLQKQKIYSAQIKQLQEKLIAVSLNNIQVRSFWMKLKSILRVSLERARVMGMLSESLARKYDEVMALITVAHQQSFQMREYLKVENLLKKRTVEAMMTTKQIIFENTGPLESLQGGKNRSESILKLSIKPSESVNLSPNNPKISNIREQNDVHTINKLKSITRVKKKGEKIRVQNNQIKKSQLAWQKYQNSINDVMNCKPQNVFDKKKSKSENEEKIYDTLFQRNINNHKIIAKYTHQCSKLKLFIMNKVPKKRLVSQKRFNEGARQHQPELVSEKNIMRAKTSKKHKTANVRIQSGQSQKVDVLKGG